MVDCAKLAQVVFDGIQNQGETTIDCGGPCTSTLCNAATQSTSLNIEQLGWFFASCGTTDSLSLIGFKNLCSAKLDFPKSIISGTYVIAPSASVQGLCALTVSCVPQQPTISTWYGQSGIVIVSKSSTSISAIFSNIICAQKSFSFPIVNVSGSLTCYQ